MWSMSLHFEEAPRSWLWDVNRARIIGLTVLWGLADLYYFWEAHSGVADHVPGYSVDEGVSWSKWRYLGLGLTYVTWAFVLWAGKVSGRVFELSFCFLHVADLNLMFWGAGTSEDLHYRTLEIPLRGAIMSFCGIRTLPLCCCVLMDIVSVTTCAVVMFPWIVDPSLACQCMFSAMLVFVTVRIQQREWRNTFNLHRELLIEKEASETLLSTTCEASFWMAGDSFEVLRSDPRLDAVVGEPLLGKQLDDYMPEEEAARLQASTLDSAIGMFSHLAPLLPSTLQSAGLKFPISVELFIVDRRKAFSMAKQGGRLGFLIGVRLSAPDPAAVAALGQENVLLEDPFSRAPGSPSASQVDWKLAGSVVGSLPETLQSAKLPPPKMHTCSRSEIEVACLNGDSALDFPKIECPQAQATLQSAIALVYEHALGGALVCIADSEVLSETFDANRIPGRAGPTTRTCDEGYMTDRLRGIHISDGRFAAAFRDFTRHSDNDRWPADYPDSAARGRPKDGAFLLSKSGYRVKCAAKLLGLQPAATWENVGTKHEAALACAWAAQGSFVLVKSDSGSLHLVLRRGDALHVYALSS